DRRSYSMDGIRKIAHNTSMKYLRIDLSGASNFHHKVYNYLSNNSDASILDLRFQNAVMGNEIIIDSFFLSLSRKFECLKISRCESITAEALHQVYKGMIDGSVKLLKFHLENVYKRNSNSFLSLIGISFRRGKFFSDRDIEVFEDGHSNFTPDIFRIFVGSIEIVMDNYVYNGVFG
ncbi:hypothetical protein PMAYCL1PPCAC_01461, partial [Pristionchus mayeri]